MAALSSPRPGTSAPTCCWITSTTSAGRSARSYADGAHGGRGTGASTRAGAARCLDGRSGGGRPAAAPAADGGAARGGPVPAAAAAVAGRGRGGSAQVRANSDADRQGRREYGLGAGPNDSLRDGRPVPESRGGRARLRRQAGHPELGAGDAGEGHARAGRLPRERVLRLLQRRPARDVVGLAVPA